MNRIVTTEALGQANDAVFLRILGLARLYLREQTEDVRFFASDSRSIVLCIDGGCAFLYAAPDASAEECEDSVLTVRMMAHEVYANRLLPEMGGIQKRGQVYRLCAQTLASYAPLAVNHSLREAFAVMEPVFFAQESADERMRRYADLSHRIRHACYQVYEAEGAAALCVANEMGQVLIDQLCVLPKKRRNGLAVRLIHTILNDHYPAASAVFFSRDEQSDRFYQKYHAEPAGEWVYCRFSKGRELNESILFV